ncbi:hypothetical protein Poli38472_008636 [Pythium oligandrum]|uniref:Tubulin--tyrosine ligase-like protein 5 n=1 Tax=Pythium oligandrum TaxID=41045 RepID=A0A8K1C441_PYTOL|nr:hypothetical protein Poli38472_008636 [Pythium oligandrum]|eukprot:TMW55988.1 hypothetical protein Poli38472_008636 [Pythium oligandrum]
MQGPNQGELERLEERNDSAEAEAFFYLLVSTMDSASKPVLFFPYPCTVQLERPCPPGYEVRKIRAKDTSVRITYSFIKRYMYNAMRQVFKTANIKKLTKASSNNWNVFWGHHLKSAEYAALMSYQKVNHFPGSFELGRKDRLCGNLLRMRKKHPDAYRNVIPETYLTANEYEKQQFLQQFTADPHVLWVLKPPNLSCGRGIKLVTAATTPSSQLTKKKAYVAQRYVANPFLINDLKFDLRIYVLVTSYDPLKIYLFNDGLVRFCTEKYSTSKAGLKNHFGHLTNYSVNKKNTTAFQPNQDNEDDEDSFSSSKWSLQTFFKYVREQGKGAQLESFLESVEDLIVKTFIAVESKILMMTTGANPNGCELYGFDILIEGEEMKPWLLEVNVFPSLSSSSPMDKRIKTILVSDVFQTIGVPFQDANAALQQTEKDKKDRLLGMNRKNTKGEKKKDKKTLDDLIQSKGSTLELDDADLQILKEMEEEDHRKGHFKRIFPTASSWETYGALFETNRYKNVLCMRWLQSLEQNQRRRSTTGKK